MKRIATLIFVLLFAGVTSAQLPRDEARLLTQAHEAFNAGQYQTVVQLLQPVVAEYPDAADAHRLLGHAFERLNQPDQARKAFAASLTHGGLRPDALAALAQVERNAGRPAAALAPLQLLSLVEPGTQSYQLIYANTLRLLGQHEAAAAVLEAMLAQDPASVEALRLAANVHLARGETQAAANTLTTAYWLQPDPALARAIGELHLQHGDPESGATWYTLAGAATPDPATALREAELLAGAEKYDRARQRLLTLQRNSAVDTPRLLGLLGRVELALGNDAAAIAAWDQAIAAGLTDADILRAMVSQAITTQNENLKLYLDRFAEQRPDETGLLVQGYIAAGDRASASRALQHHIAQHGLTREAQDWLKLVASSAPASDL